MRKNLKAGVLSISISLLFCYWVIYSQKDRDVMNIIAYWNNSDKNFYLIVTDSMLAGHDIQTFLAALYPQYGGGNIEKRDLFYFVTLTDRYTLNEQNVKTMFDFTKKTEGYTVTSYNLLTKNLDH